MTFLLTIVLFFSCGDDETYSVTLTFQSMHCEECKAQLQETLEKIGGVNSVALGGNSATAAVKESARFDLAKFRCASPRDMKLKSVSVSLRGRVSESSGQFKLTTKAAAQVFHLVNPEKRDPLSELQQQLGGANKFRIDGVAVEATKLELHSFEKTEYDE